MRVPLTQGKFALVDAEDAERVMQFKWFALNKGGWWYAGRQRREPRTIRGQPGKSYTLYLHRFLLDAPDGTDVDHINGDGLDNRRANLRICTHAENSYNARVTRSRAGYKGVRADGTRWRAAIHQHGREISLGSHATPEEAARAYDRAATEIFGVYALLNFPNES
jgi:hypothetical protein